MGSSAPKSETTIKGGKPFIVREWVSPEYLNKLSGIATQYGKRAQWEQATYREMVNRNMARYGEKPLFGPMTSPTGEVIKPDQASPVIDPSTVIDPAMWKTPKVRGSIATNSNTPRDAYNNAIQGKPKPGSVYPSHLQS